MLTGHERHSSHQIFGLFFLTWIRKSWISWWHGAGASPRDYPVKACRSIMDDLCSWPPYFPYTCIDQPWKTSRHGNYCKRDCRRGGAVEGMCAGLVLLPLRGCDNAKAAASPVAACVAASAGVRGPCWSLSCTLVNPRAHIWPNC
jgi:hypothetical protein